MDFCEGKPPVTPALRGSDVESASYPTENHIMQESSGFMADMYITDAISKLKQDMYSTVLSLGLIMLLEYQGKNAYVSNVTQAAPGTLKIQG